MEDWKMYKYIFLSKVKLSFTVSQISVSLRVWTHSLVPVLKSSFTPAFTHQKQTEQKQLQPFRKHKEETSRDPSQPEVHTHEAGHSLSYERAE